MPYIQIDNKEAHERMKNGLAVVATATHWNPEYYTGYYDPETKPCKSIREMIDALEKWLYPYCMDDLTVGRAFIYWKPIERDVRDYSGLPW